MDHNLDKDWRRVVAVWEKWKSLLPYPRMGLFAGIVDLRKHDRGIDFPLRRLLDSEKYGDCIRTYGAPSSKYPRYPFRWNNKVWDSVRIKLQSSIRSQTLATTVKNHE